MEKSAIFLMFFSLLFVRCGKHENSNYSTRIYNWENGSIKAEEHYINDTIKEGVFKRYYQNGVLESEYYYHNNKRNGLWIKYFKNGKRNSVDLFNDGLHTGYWLEYFESGELQKYYALNLKGKAVFEIDYSRDGGIEKIAGFPVTELTINKDTLSVADTLRIKFLVAIPHGDNPRLEFYDDFGTTRSLQTLPISDKEGYGTAEFEKVAGRGGTMNWGGTYTIKFQDVKQKDLIFEFVGFTVVK